MGKEDANKPMSIVNDNMSDTPETDAEGYGDGRHPFVTTEFARKLERERDEAIRLLKLCADYSLTTHQCQVEEFLKKIK